MQNARHLVEQRFEELYEQINLPSGDTAAAAIKKLIFAMKASKLFKLSSKLKPWSPPANIKFLAGVDEVGRGPLAGDVVTAAVILPANHGIEGLG